MSKKSKLILATALFGAALFGASCGSSGDGGTTPQTGTGSGGGTGGGTGGGGGGGGGTPSPTVEGRVLALLDVGTVGAGTLKPVTICELRSNGTAMCGNDLNPTADLELQYIHEFSNGNVLLIGPSNVLYLFDGSRVRMLDTFRSLASATTSTQTGGITAPISANAFISRLPNLVMMFDPGNLVAVAENGTVIKEDSGVSHVGASCPTVTKSGTTYSISGNGNVTSVNRTINRVLASAEGKFLVHDSNNRLYLRDDPCLPDGQPVGLASIANVQDAQMVKVGNDFYIAVRHGASGNQLNYYKVSSSDSTLLTTRTMATGSGRFNYTLDGEGRLYATVTAADKVDVYAYDRNTGTITQITTTALSANVAGMLGFAERVLVRDNAATVNLYDITPTGGVQQITPADSNLQEHFDNCTHGTHTKAVDGIGTNFIRCMFDNGSQQRLSSIAFVNSQYRRPNTFVTIASGTTGATQFDILFGANALIVRHAVDNRIRLCTTTSTTSPSISCSDTGVLNAARPLGFAPLDSLANFYRSYLKSRESEVSYRSGTALFVGNVFNPTPISSISISDATGGNASFDLTRFAFSFQPAGALCNTQILYLSSPTASQKFYTIAQPSNACVTRILKVY